MKTNDTNIISHKKIKNRGFTRTQILVSQSFSFVLTWLKNKIEAFHFNRLSQSDRKIKQSSRPIPAPKGSLGVPQRGIGGRQRGCFFGIGIGSADTDSSSHPAARQDAGIGLPIKPKFVNGFTIVEMIVSIGIFASVLVFAVGALVSIVSANKQAQTIKTIVNNLNYSLETMIRNIRTGSNYDCEPHNSGGMPDNCPISSFDNFGTSLQFLDQRGYWVTYDLVSNAGGGYKITRTLQNPPKYNGVVISTFDLTSPEVNINRLRFYVDGAEQGDTTQPNVRIIIGGNINLGNGRTARFDVETMATQRLFNQ